MDERDNNHELINHARQAFRTHLVGKALEARQRYRWQVDSNVIVRMLDDRDVVRYPTQVQFNAQPLCENEFAYAQPLGFHPSDGYGLFVHPRFEDRPEIWPDLIAYHIPVINYGRIVEPDDAELFGATLLGMDVDMYYYQLCQYLAELHEHRSE